VLTHESSVVHSSHLHPKLQMLHGRMKSVHFDTIKELKKSGGVFTNNVLKPAFALSLAYRFFYLHN